MKNQKLKKILLTTIISLEIIFLNVPAAKALDIPDPADAAEDAAKALEERYHLDLGSIQNQGESFNVADTKKTAPQVMVFFNPTDPKAGEKITAEALPMYFSNPKEKLYYTWFLKHNVKGEPNDGNTNWDKADGITVNDYKIEAMKIIAQGGVVSDDFSKSNQDDNDGYKARFGGDDQTRTNDYCYLHDFRTGVDYELRSKSVKFFCNGVEGDVKCVRNKILTCNDTTGSYKLCRETASVAKCTDTDGNGIGTVGCATGSPRCTEGFTYPAEEYNCTDNVPSGNKLCNDLAVLPHYNDTITCTPATGSRNGCRHLFPCAWHPDNYVDGDHEGDCDGSVGDGNFRSDEEDFWGTDPNDSDTAKNGNKDEANLTGLGINTFTWNYQEGDEVGVVVEGTSMIPTKHGDSSMMKMWAFPKNNCSPDKDPDSRRGSYTENIKGYDVTFKTYDMDLNKCLNDNLIDPREGKIGKLEVDLNYSPESPINDPSEDETGDRLVAHTSVSNASKENAQLYYEWSVYLSPNGTFSPPDGWKKEDNVTDTLVKRGLISGPVKGNGLDSLNLNLNITDDILQSRGRQCGGANRDKLCSLATVFPDDVGYMQIKVLVKEIYDSGDIRTGRSDVIIRIISTDKKINTYGITYSGGLLSLGGPICRERVPGSNAGEGEVQKFTCFVLKNDIVGVQVNGTGLQNYYWTLNGKPLNCTSTISNDCSDKEQTNTNFFPVTGNPGDTYTLDVTAINIVDGKTVHLVRNFQVVDPFVQIISIKEDQVWPKFLGDYVNVNDGSLNHDFSKSAFQTFSGNGASLKAEFHPLWLVNNKTTNPLSGGLMFEWLVDGEKIAADNQEDISLPIAKEPGDVYNVTLNAVYYHSQQVRQALQKIWGISQFDSPETYMSAPIQIEIVENETLSFKDNPKNFLANLASHIPGQVMFMLRILLTILVILFTTSVVFSFMPSPKISRYE